MDEMMFPNPLNTQKIAKKQTFSQAKKIIIIKRNK